MLKSVEELFEDAKKSDKQSFKKDANDSLPSFTDETDYQMKTGKVYNAVAFKCSASDCLISEISKNLDKAHLESKDDYNPVDNTDNKDKNKDGRFN